MATRIAEEIYERYIKALPPPERLRLLLVLTVADIRAVGPGVWNGWKGQLMRELYFATEAVFRGGRGSDPAAHFKVHQTAAAQEARERLYGASSGEDAALRVWATEMEDAYFTAFTPEEQSMHFALAGQAAGRGGAAAAAKIVSNRNAAEIAIAVDSTWPRLRKVKVTSQRVRKALAMRMIAASRL